MVVGVGRTSIGFSTEQWAGGDGTLTIVGIHVVARWFHGKGSSVNRGDATLFVAGGLALEAFADIVVVTSDLWRRWLVSERARVGGGLTTGGCCVLASLNGVSMGEGDWG